MSSISLIKLPYDSARFDERMGRGPGALIGGALLDELRSKNVAVNVVSVLLPSGFQTEASALVELQRRAVIAIREAVAQKSRPILLSGNCGPAALSAIAALGAKSTGVIWFDAHGDFNTPETSASGFLDGMALAILAGQCWPQLAKRFDGFEPMPMNQVIQIGVRDLDTEEAMRLERSAISRISPGEFTRLQQALEDLSGRISQVYVHVDVDVLDLSEGFANSYACAGGLSLEELCRALELISGLVSIAAGSVTSYDPGADGDGRIGRAIPRIVGLLAGNG